MKQNMLRSGISGLAAGAATYLCCIFCAEHHPNRHVMGLSGIVIPVSCL